MIFRVSVLATRGAGRDGSGMRRLSSAYLFGLLPLLSPCAQSDVVAERIERRSQLIGGPGALGEVGDYLLANGRIRAIVQGPGYSRGFGVYGGSLIDADLQRPARGRDSQGGRGADNFSELFPSFLLGTMNATDIVTRKNADGSASVIVYGHPDDYLFLAGTVNELLLPSDLEFSNEFRLAPGAAHIEVTTRVKNQSATSAVEFPSVAVQQFVPEFSVIPVGDVLLFGGGNDIFTENTGFDVRFSLEAAFREEVNLPQFPGFSAPFIATRGDGVSYGFMSGIEDPDVSFIARAGYPDADPRDLIVPFFASAFTGVFYAAAPERLEPGETFSFKKYFLVGNGDVASIRDQFHALRGDATGQVAGLIRRADTLAPVANAEIIVYDDDGRVFSQHSLDENGQFIGRLPPGDYSLQVLADGRSPGSRHPVRVQANRKSFLRIDIPPPGWVSVRVRNEDGIMMPARCSLVGTYAASATGFDPRTFLFNLAIGERIRATDYVPDEFEDPSTRRFVEEVIIAANGTAKTRVRPGRYQAVCSRGIEYETEARDIVVRPGEIAEVDVQLTRAFETPGWISGDYHLHSANSVDASISLDRRIAHVAAEGVEIACSSDHNFITDYSQAIARQGLDQWVQGVVGLELTTIELGHFNGFPLRYDPGPITKGAFEWAKRTPSELFADLRSRGRLGPDQTIVQVNHPRESLMGYFNTFGFNPDTGVIEGPRPGGDGILASLLVPTTPEFRADAFDWNFDALEVFNGKRYDLIRTQRMPSERPDGPLPDDLPAPGTILRDEDGRVAFPGGMDDWFTMLRQGRVVTAMGNSDSHGEDAEPGSPRTYLKVPDDRPGHVKDRDLVTAVRQRQALPTNGPFLTVAVESAAACGKLEGGRTAGRRTCSVGELVQPEGSRLTVEVELKAASWVKVESLRFLLDGEEVHREDGDNASLATVRTELLLPDTGDHFLVVEAAGSESLFPVITPLEIPPFVISEAVRGLQSALGGDDDGEDIGWGALEPSISTEVTPYAFTNPVFIDGNGNGQFDPPGISQTALKRAATHTVPVKGRRRARGPYLLQLFESFHGH